jgi:serine/threonine protein kinase
MLLPALCDMAVPLPPALCLWCSFGVVLWEMFTGRSPYPGMSHSQVLHSVSTGKVLELPACAPPAFAKLVSACLARSPTDR